jgi:two-component system, chemotaxis family, chemotaxis protein CheY
MRMSDSRHRVLVVEDSATMRGFVTAALESGGPYAVTQAESGFHALKILPRNRYDLIITDINMPDINGLELVQFIRKSDRHRSTALIIISTQSSEKDRLRGMSLGADEYLAKPLSADTLLSAVDRLLSGSPSASG